MSDDFKLTVLDAAQVKKNMAANPGCLQRTSSNIRDGKMWTSILSSMFQVSSGSCFNGKVAIWNVGDLQKVFSWPFRNV